MRLGGKSKIKDQINKAWRQGDGQDYKEKPALAGLPPRYSLVSYFTPVLFQKGSLGECWGFLQWHCSFSRISAVTREAARWALGSANPSALCTGASLLVENFYGHFLQSWDVYKFSFQTWISKPMKLYCSFSLLKKPNESEHAEETVFLGPSPSRTAVRRQCLQWHWHEATACPTWTEI